MKPVRLKTSILLAIASGLSAAEACGSSAGDPRWNQHLVAVDRMRFANESGLRVGIESSGSLRRFRIGGRSEVDSISPPSKPSLFRINFELDLGAGSYSNLSRRASEDTVRAASRGSSILRIRLSPFYGPVGLHLKYEIQYTGWILILPQVDRMPDKDGYLDDSHYTLVSIMPAISFRFFHGRWRVEPQAGYQWMNERTKTDYYGEGPPFKDHLTVRNRIAHFGGKAAGLEQAVVLSKRLRVRSTFSYCNLGGSDRRLNIELQSGVSVHPTSAHPVDRDFWVFSAVGVGMAWRNDNRRNFVVYIGIGGW